MGRGSDEASEQLRKGSLKSGIQLIKQAMQPVRCATRGAFTGKLAQRALCFQARQTKLAFPTRIPLFRFFMAPIWSIGNPIFDDDRMLQKLLASICNKLPGAIQIPATAQERIYQRLCQPRTLKRHFDQGLSGHHRTEKNHGQRTGSSRPRKERVQFVHFSHPPPEGSGKEVELPLKLMVISAISPNALMTASIEQRKPIAIGQGANFDDGTAKQELRPGFRGTQPVAQR